MDVNGCAFFCHNWSDNCYCSTVSAVATIIKCPSCRLWCQYHLKSALSMTTWCYWMCLWVALLLCPHPYGDRPSRTQRITWEPKGLVCPNSEWRFPTLDATRTSFKVKRSRSPGPLMLTHPAAYLPMWSYCIPLVGIFLGHFHINLYQTCMQYSNEGPQHWNWALFLKIAF